MPVADVKGFTEPRVFTPPLRELTPETSAGFLMIRFAREVLGITLLPWQEWLAIHALELREDGSLRFRIVVTEVARQQGKSTFSQVLGLFFLFVRDAALVIGAAQDIAIAKDIWSGAVQMVQDIPELAEQMAGRPRTTNGQIELVLTDFRRWVVKASNRRAGRGLSGDLVFLDELREQRNWGGWSSLTKTTIARPDAQVWAFSNAGDVTSVVLRHLRMQAHKALGDPDGWVAQSDPDSLLVEDGEADETAVEDDSLGWFEWSAPPECHIDDITGWRHANPSLGYGFVTLAALRSARASDPPAQFRTEVLCQFVDSMLSGAFPPGAWAAGRFGADEAATDDAQIVGDVTAGVAVSWGRDRASIVFGGRRADGRPTVEVVACRAGTDWVVDWLSSPERVVRPSRVVVQPSSPAGTLVSPLRAAGFRVAELSGADIGRAHGVLFDAVAGPEGEPCGPLLHAEHPVLDMAADTAEIKPFPGGTWAWDLRASPGDVSPLVAATGVVWAVMTGKAPPPSSRRDGVGRRPERRRGGGATSDLTSMQF